MYCFNILDRTSLSLSQVIHISENMKHSVKIRLLDPIEESFVAESAIFLESDMLPPNTQEAEDPAKLSVQNIWSTKYLPLLNSKISQLAITDPRTVVDRHRVESIRNKKPDDVAYPNNSTFCEMNILFVGELKKRRSATSVEFTNEEKDQIISRCVDVLEVQVYRSFIFGYLTDSCIIMFFKVTRQDEIFEYEYSPPVFLYHEGERKLLWLYSMSFEDLGWNLPKIFNSNYLYRKFLGSGIF